MRSFSFGLALTLAVSFAASTFAAEILNLNTNSGVSAPGGNVASWTGSVGGVFTPTNAGPTPAPTLIAGPNGTQVINFTGVNSLDNLSFGQSSVPEATLFIVASVNGNSGGYNALAAGRSSSGNDYQTGFNIDQGPGGSSNLNTINVESVKGSGGTNLLNPSTSYAFGTYHVFEVNIYNGGQQLIVDGTTEQSRGGNANSLNLSDLYVGSRNYGSNTGFLIGNIGAVQIYSGELTSLQANEVGYTLGREFGIQTSFTPEPGSLLLAVIAAAGLAGTVIVRRARKN